MHTNKFIKQRSIRLIHYQYLLLTIILLLIKQYSQAQVLSLYDAVDKTITNYPLLQQRASEVAANRAHIKTVNGYRLPTLKLMDEVTAGTANSLPGGYFSQGIIPSVSGSITSAQSTDVASGNFAVSYLDWPFYTFGYYNAQKKNAAAALATNVAALNSDKYVLTQNVVSLYLDWIKKYRLMQIEQENLQRSQTILNAIKATVLNGLKPGVDSSTANAEYAKSKIAFLQARDNYNYDLISLATYTGVPSEGMVPDTAILTNAKLSALQVQQPDSISVHHPLLDVYEKQYEQQLALNKAETRVFMPKLSLDGAGWIRGSSISPTNQYATDWNNGLTQNSRYNYLFGLTLSYNITDLKHQHDIRKEGEYYAKAKEDALHTQEYNLNRVLKQTDIAYSTAQEKLNELPLALQSARDAFAQQSALYRAGLNTLVDVTNAQYVLEQTETEYVIAQDDLIQLLYLKAGLSNQADKFLQTFKR